MPDSIYCFDTNVFLEAWNKYYSKELCPSYWDKIEELARQGVVFTPSEVQREIQRHNDAINVWIADRDFIVRDITEDVQRQLQAIYDADPSHQYLTAQGKGKNAADPWVIAHAMVAGATVVTKEYRKPPNQGPTKIKLPDVCDNMGVRWISDFEFVAEIGMKFTCHLP